MLGVRSALDIIFFQYLGILAYNIMTYLYLGDGATSFLQVKNETAACCPWWTRSWFTPSCHSISSFTVPQATCLAPHNLLCCPMPGISVSGYFAGYHPSMRCVMTSSFFDQLQLRPSNVFSFLEKEN